MQLIHFFVTYFLFLLASSLLITAFFCVTRGETEVLPDGTIHKYGKILKGYFFFWFKEKGQRAIYYTGDQLAGLTVKMRQYYTEPLTLAGNVLVPDTITSFEAPATILNILPVLRNELQVQFKLQLLDNDHVRVTVYEEEPVYVFPLWLRTVMAGCITCTPTVYGNITYWSAIYVFRNSVLYDSLFGCFASPHAGVFIVWIAYWISLAWLNTVLWNIYNK